eukprot:gene25736-biopygen7512
MNGKQTFTKRTATESHPPAASPQRRRPGTPTPRPLPPPLRAATAATAATPAAAAADPPPPRPRAARRSDLFFGSLWAAAPDSLRGRAQSRTPGGGDPRNGVPLQTTTLLLLLGLAAGALTDYYFFRRPQPEGSTS